MQIQREQIGGCQRQEVRVGEMGEEDQKVQIFSYKINKSCVVMYSMEAPQKIKNRTTI